MHYLVNAKEMKECDRVTIREFSVPSLVLMERAALTVVEELSTGEFCLDNVLVVCGSGNNGGDGFAIARLLYQEKIPVRVLFPGREESLTEETKIQKKICENYGINICSNCEIHEYTCIVDAIFGVGLSREIKGHYQEMIEKINASGKDVLAVDIPSGVSADTGAVLGIAVQAKKTVTFAFGKVGQFLHPGADCCGRVVIRQIGITEESFKGNFPRCSCMDETDLCHLPMRKADSHKGTYGKTLLIAGQHNMAGAACLSGEAAYRTGTGLVQILTEECNRIIVQSCLPEAILSTYESDHFKIDLEKLLHWSTAIGIGPGFGKDSLKNHLLQEILEKADCPLVLDADALNMIAEDPNPLLYCKQPVIITPHIMEMSRLTGLSVGEIKANPMETSIQFSKTYHVICVLKDARTIITDGTHVCINTTGTNGMATGGSGDVLTGIITGLLAQGMEAFTAAKIGVWIHGKAGELAAESCGNRSTLAKDLIHGMMKLLTEAEQTVCEEKRNEEV